ncbi:MAG TPA: efflux RND transporter permease subunit [Bacteroidales bacterium]|nr:efflux RND transporter permease subunit [Bacteroidales bacterium]HQN16602.1 efflux RND transporter permease subunit [Bacteroidales bacterium]HQP15848.1 efflux RND transporter permease subunit [Bacteroidales bacterium]
MSIYGSAVKKPVTTLMVFIAIIVVGIYSFTRLPIDLYPEIEMPSIMVYTGYSGANAADIETNISEPIENTLNTVSNLKEVYSTSRDNASVVTLEFEYGTDLDGAANDVRDALGMVTRYLPDGAEEPVIFKFTTNMMPIMFYAITADESYEGIEEEMKEKLINSLNRINGMGSISLIGAPIREVSVDVDPRKMEAYNLTIEQIGNILRAENLNMPAGTVDMGQMTYPLRVQGEFEQSDEIKNIVLTNFQGKTVYLKDVSTVNDSIRKMSLDEKINGRRGVRMMIMKQSGANTVQIAKEVKKQIAELKKNLPADVQIDPIIDTSEFIVNSINNLTETLLFAFLFVLLVVLFFLGRWRATFIIILTIPISLIVAFIYLGISGNTINIISLSALSIGIGMVVDDAIVVLENITRHIERGSSPREAAIYATNEVWLAVIASTLTIVCVFFPLTLVSGMTGIMFKQLGWIVTITILTSALAAITITPMLSSKFLGLKPIKKKPGWFSHEHLVIPFFNRMDNFYVKTLKWSLHHKKIVVIGAVVIFLVSIVLATTLKTEFIPETDEGRFSAEIELPAGVRVDETVKITKKLEDFINREIPEKVLTSTSSGANDQQALAALFSNSGSNIINVTVKLVTSSERERSTSEIADQFRSYLDSIPEIVKYNVTTGGVMSFGGGNTVDLEIFGYDFDQTTALANQMAERIRKIEGAKNVIISREKSKPELRVTLDKDKMSQNGLSTAVVSTMIRNRFLGLTATQFRESGNEYDVLVRFEEKYRSSIPDIENISIPSATGMIRLGDIATITEFWSPPNIEREHRERIVTVKVTPYKVSLGEMANRIKAEVKKVDAPAGIMMNVGGSYEDMEDSFKDLGLLLLLSLVLVYLVMASQFESLKMPLIIMVSVPFAFTGVILALVMTKTTLSIIAALGAILLIGIAVKNAIVLIDFTNLMRDRGNSLDEAILKAGRSRLRPVLMTTLTTILGMLPLALSTGEGSEIWKPMGIVVIGGLVFSTLVTMVIVPVVYRIVVRRTERKAKRDAVAVMKSMNI